MRFNFSKILLTLVLTLVLSTISRNTFAELITSTGSGLWTDPIWTPQAPTDGDEILIDTDHTVTIPFLNNVSLDNVTIEVRGTLSIPVGGLTLDANSIVVIDDEGSITGFFSIINIGGTIVPVGIGQPILGPQYIDETGGLQPDAPPGYVPLPIELISFNTTLSGQVVEILWATAAEIDNDYFTLERSEDGVNWEIIGEEAGAGSSTVRLDYSFIDHNPVPGISYYRLKQTDYDGQFEYFDPAVVLYEPDNLFKVFPNPTTGVLQLTTSSDLSNAIISIKNLSGQTKAVRVDASSHQASIDVSELPTGVYLLEIVFPQSILTKRIVKN